ncbi:MAG: ACT domain-containing protein [Actinomycetota bacterium]
MDAASRVARLLDELRELNDSLPPGEFGLSAAHERALLVDSCVAEIFEGGDIDDGVALVALGGYGRGELAPHSDVDLLILHDGVKRIRDVAEKLFYPLWDARIEVGHAVRTPKESASEAEARLDVAASMLDARLLAGDEGVFEDMRSRVLKRVRRDPEAFAGRLAEDNLRRHERFSSVSRNLEPDLKEGAGGLRDIDSLGWLAKSLGAGDGLAGLGELGLLRAREVSLLDEAREFLFRARSWLHLSAGARTDRLVMEQQPPMAAQLGFDDQPGLPAPDALMRAVFEHGRAAQYLVQAAFARHSRPERDRTASIEATPERVLAVFAEAAERGSPVPPSLLDAVDRTWLQDPVEWTAGVRDEFLRILRTAHPSAVLESLDRLGLLVAFMPEWAPVRCRPQRDPFHRFSVDVHLFEALDEMGALLAGDSPGDAVAAEAASAVRDPDALLVGALMHDIGKVGSGNHVEIGGEVADQALQRMRLPEGTRELAHFLVSKHLLLSDTATRRDLADEDLVLDVAARVGDQEHLAALYLLTTADAAATGPQAWTPWRATLIRELVSKVQHVFERGDMGPEAAGALAQRTREIRDALNEADPEEVGRFLERMPRAYLLTMPAEDAASHFPLVAPPLGPGEFRSIERLGERPGAYRISVAAADRPGLLLRITGALALAGFSIHSAQVFTTEDGVAVDVFDVEGTFEEEVDDERWGQFREALGEALAERLSLEDMVREKRLYYPPPRADVPVEVTVDNEASDFYTVIEIGAPDRIGLLFDLTSALFELQLDVHLAKVATYGGRVVDAFYVRDRLGRKVEDRDRVEEIERSIADRLRD